MTLLHAAQVQAGVFKTFAELFLTHLHSTHFLERKIDWCLQLIAVMWKWNPCIISSYLKTSTLYAVTAEVAIQITKE